MDLPFAENLLDRSFEPLPFFLLGDEIFTLKQWLIRPYLGSSLTEEQRVYKFYCKCHDEQFHYSNPHDDMIEKTKQVVIIR